MQVITMDIKEKIMGFQDELIQLRRDFHKHPELGFKEYWTSKIIADYLEKYELKGTREIAGTGVMGLLEGTAPCQH